MGNKQTLLTIYCVITLICVAITLFTVGMVHQEVRSWTYVPSLPSASIETLIELEQTKASAVLDAFPEGISYDGN